MRFLLKGAKIATKRNLAIKITIPLFQKNTGRITEADFVRFLLKGAKIAPKKKASLIKKVNTLYPPNTPGRGVSFPSFKVTGYDYICSF